MSAVTDKGGAGDAGDMLQYGEMARMSLRTCQWARNDLDPWRETGNYARGALAVLLGATPDTSSPEYGALRRSFQTLISCKTRLSIPAWRRAKSNRPSNGCCWQIYDA